MLKIKNKEMKGLVKALKFILTTVLEKKSQLKMKKLRILKYFFQFSFQLIY